MKKVIISILMMTPVFSAFATNSNSLESENAESVTMSVNIDGQNNKTSSSEQANAVNNQGETNYTDWTFTADTNETNRLALYYRCQWGEHKEVQVVYLTFE